MQQRTDKWFAARLGRATSSRMSDICARTRSGWGASRANYAAELVCERLTGQPTQGYINAAMQWGIDTEPQAKAAYEFLTDSTVEDAGFVEHPKIKMSGASPDGLVGDDGLVEVKCPQTATHIKTLLDDKVEGKYVLQVQWQLACTGRQWCDFVSFDPRMPHGMDTWIKRIERDDKKVAELEEIVTAFLKEVDETVKKLCERYQEEPAA